MIFMKKEVLENQSNYKKQKLILFKAEKAYNDICASRKYLLCNRLCLMSRQIFWIIFPEFFALSQVCFDVPNNKLV